MSNSIKKLYDEWSIQGFVLFSLSLQIILILFAPFRKRTGNMIVISLIWLAYLLADWAAIFALGLISSRQKYTQKFDDHADIRVFWAPFLLLHLGGPDTVTAFAMEDNALWLRHLVGLLSQVVTAIIVFGQSLPSNKLWVPTLLLFVVGTIKYGERTYALFQANLNTFRKSMLKAPDPGPDYAEYMEKYSAIKKDNREPNIWIEEAPERAMTSHQSDLDAIAEVQHAYQFFEIFKGLIVDHIFSTRDHWQSRDFFGQRTAEVALKVVAVELNFFYTVLYTKVVVIRSIFGYFARFISSCAIVAALSTFYSLDKHGFGKIDVGITYTLLFGAIALDTIALFMLAFSDWTVAVAYTQQVYTFTHTSNKRWKGINICFLPLFRCFLPLFRYFLHLKKINWGEDIESMSCLGRARQILFRRWSESLNQYNLIHYCLEEGTKQNRSHFASFCRMCFSLFNLKDFYDKITYVSKKPFEKKLWDFIFVQLKKKSDLADEPESPDTAKRICSARGEWVLQNNDWTTEGSSKLMHYIVDVGFDQSLILWHIATDLCYHDHTIHESDEDTRNRREFCKILSDYMLYLLVMQPTMMSAVAGIGQIRFRDTCAEAKRFFDKKVDLRQEQDQEHKQACTRILEVNTDLEPASLKGDISKSVLFDACILAKELRNLEYKKGWGVMSEVWVEMLSYAASHCRSNTHVAQLSKGGELITFVWLLMAHLGIGDHFQYTATQVSKISIHSLQEGVQSDSPSDFDP
ncbi:uncharacterized protein LOC132169912 [Corylus avellana]|uniref:uncharacterized protein LOC132169912 n=1 Tax=Corylus avellana TaxID=13451 RepID=UPI00286CC39B|nr:uncharacterized protein LOC132169912 [Corylus avellana]